MLRLHRMLPRLHLAASQNHSRYFGKCPTVKIVISYIEKIMSSNENAAASVRRRGPKSLLSYEQESLLVQWVLGHQSIGQRVSRDDVIAHARQLRQDATFISGQNPKHINNTSQSIGMGWCNRFIARHPELTLRSGGATIPPHTPNAIVNFTISESIPETTLAEQNGQFKVQNAANRFKRLQKSSEKAGPRKYNRKHMEAAVEMYLAGRRMNEVVERFPQLHPRTIRRRVLRAQRGEVDKRRGPRPLLEGEPEQALVAWILDRQRQGLKVSKQDILTRANEHYRA